MSTKIFAVVEPLDQCVLPKYNIASLLVTWVAFPTVLLMGPMKHYLEPFMLW